MTDIDVLLNETRTFVPPDACRAQAHVRSAAFAEEAARDPDAFWAKMARNLEWIAPCKSVLEWSPPHAKWFTGGRLNVSVNCVDRHVRGAARNTAALIWEGEPGDQRTLTYWDLHRDVQKFANVLKSLGVGRGDRVGIYLPLIPAVAVAVLACARIGAIHSVVFGGFASHSLATRIDDARPKLMITADGGMRAGRAIPYQSMFHEA